MRTLRIKSDGTAHGTQVLDDDGSDLTESMHITRVTWEVSGRGFAKVTIEAVGWPADVEAVAERVEESVRLWNGLREIARRMRPSVS